MTPTFDISADGRFLVTTWRVTGPEATERSVLLRVDLASGERRVIADDPDADLEHPAISPDGSAIAFTRETISTPDRAPRMTLQYLRFGDQPRSVAASMGSSADLADLVERWHLAGCHGRSGRPGSGIHRRAVDIDGHPAHRRRLRLHGRRRRARRCVVRLAQLVCGTATSGADRSRWRHHRAAMRRLANAAGNFDRCHRGRRRWDGGAIMVGAARRRSARPAAVMDPRRTAEQLEQLVMAMEPVAAGRAGSTRCCCRIRRCRLATDRNSSSVVGERGADRRSTI